MVKYDGSGVEDGYPVIPAGSYPVIIHEIKLMQTKAGAEMWALSLLVSAGEHKGHWIYDNIVWSENDKAIIRQKQFLRCFGVYRDDKTEYNPWELEQKTAKVVLKIGEWEGKKRNEVTFAGYYTYKDQEQGQEQGGNEPETEPDDVPF
jgi:hypothetical protein